MPNKYPGICYRCGTIVQPGAGVFEKVTKSARKKWPGLGPHIKWQTQHHECADKYRGTSAHYIHNPAPGE